MSFVLDGLIVLNIVWAATFPRSYGREMRRTFDKLKEGWESRK